MNIAIIPARKNSRRLPRKNILTLGGNPIIAYSIEVAKKSNLFRRVFVSTDCSLTMRVAMDCGAEVLARPAHLADDVTGTPEVMQSIAADMAGCDYLCCIYPTAPMIRVEDLHVGFDLLQSSRTAPFSFAMGTEPPKDAGQWYWGTRQSWMNGYNLVSPNTIMVPIPPERVCDVNTLEDFQQCERMYAALQCEHEYSTVGQDEDKFFRCIKCGEGLPA